MKVALVNDQLKAGGAEKVIVNMANLLHRKGVKVIVVLFLSTATLDHLIDPSIPVHYIKRKGRFDIRAMLTLKKILQKVDIIHVHSRYNLRYLVFSKMLTGIKKPKVVFHEHVPVLNLDFFTKMCLQKADAYIAVIKSMCVWAEKTVRLRTSKVFYLPNTVNSPMFDITPAGVGKKIVMVGNFWDFKNQLFALELIKSLPADFTLDMYGSINSKEYYNQLQESISSNGLQNRVRLIEGMSDIYSITVNYNFAIHTSPHETGPLVLLEYMHAGLPFLTYKTGDVVDNIQHDLAESILESFDLNEWKARIEAIMMNEEARLNLQNKMKYIVTKDYTEDSYWEKLNGIYKVILN